MKLALILLLMVTNEVTIAVLIGSEPDLFDPSFNETGNIWNCLGARYQRESVEEMSESVLTCAKRNLYRGLLNNLDSECVDIGDGVTFTTETDQVISPREVFPLGEEPATFRGVIDAYSTFLSQRAARWDLGFLYPGLVMRIGPTMDSAGVLEFALEKRLDYTDRSKLRPGQLIIRRTILPQLLGFRMNLASLLPVILGVLLFVSKNAFVFSKLTLVMSTLLALKSLFLMQQMKPEPTETYDVVETGSVSQSGTIGILGGHRPRPHAYMPDGLLLQMFSATSPPFRGVNDRRPDVREKAQQQPFFHDPKVLLTKVLSVWEDLLV